MTNHERVKYLKFLVRVMLFYGIWLLPNCYCFAQNQWNIRIAQSNVDCSTNEVCYELQVNSATANAWVLGDQNYRIFFDGDLMTVTSVTSKLPSSIYNSAVIDQNVKISGQGQEAASPLDDIDDNLGFLDFNIVQQNKNNPALATQISSSDFTPVAEICILVEASIIANGGNDCLALYNSRPTTAGTVTGQYTVISENDSPGTTISTQGTDFLDMDSTIPNESCFKTMCNVINECSDLHAHLRENNCCKACRSGNLQLTTAFWSEDMVTLTSANVALNKPSNINKPLSNNSSNSIASNDGRFEGNPFANYDYAFSHAGFNNRWDIDLYGFFDLEEIRVFTKTGCCSGSADTYRVFISDAPFTNTNLATLLSDNSLPNFTMPVIPGSTPSILPVNLNGRFVRIYLEGEGILQLVEVEIIGSGNANSSPFDYTWSDGSITDNLNPTCLPDGFYEVTITDSANGCNLVKSFVVD